MTTDHKGVVAKRGLTPEDLTDVRQLAETVNRHDGLYMKLNWGTLLARPAAETNDFFYFVNGEPVGFIGLYANGSKEAEVTGMVHPEYRRRGIFTALFTAAREECRKRGIPRILIITERSSAAGAGFALKVGARYEFSEERMEMGLVEAGEPGPSRLNIRVAGQADIPELKRQNNIYFREEEEQPGEEDEPWAGETPEVGRIFYLAELDGRPVGKIDTVEENGTAMIYGFGVLPEYRGRGYGREIFTRTLAGLAQDGWETFALEVDGENERARALYRSCGFRPVTVYDYYSLKV